MKKRRLVFLPLLGLLLTGCDFHQIIDKVQDFGHKIVDPIENLLPFGKDDNKTEDQHKDDGGNQEGGGGEEQQVVAKSIKELIGLPAEIEQGEVLAASSLKATVVYSDNSKKTESVTKVELDTSKVGEASGKAYVNSLSKEFSIKVVAKEVPPVGDTITPQQAIALMDQAGEGVVVAGLQKVKGICAAGSQYDSKYKQYTTGFDGVDNFKLQFTDTKNILNGASPDGMEIVVEGYLEKYQGKYQLSYLPDTASPTGEKFTPNLVSAKAVEHDAALVSISVSETHREFYQGSTFVGETVTAHYSDGSTAPVVANFSGYNMDTLGVQTVNVSYTEKDVTKETSYTITIIEKTAVNYGTEESPLTIAQALVIINNECKNDQDMSEQAITVEGVISEIKNSWQYEGEDGRCYELNITDGTNSLYIYRCHSNAEQSPNVKVGATVKLVGYAKNFKGTLEFVDKGASKCHFLYVSGGEPVVDKEIVSVDSVAEGYPTEVVVGTTLNASDFRLNVTYDDESHGVVNATEVLGDTSVVAESVEVTVYYKVNGEEVGHATVNIKVIEKPADPVIGKTFCKISSLEDLVDGNYLVESNNYVFTGVDGKSESVVTTINDGVITGAQGMAAIEIKAMTGGYSLKVVNGTNAGKYMGGVKDSNTIKFSDTPIANTITFTEGVPTITSDSTSLQFNKASDNLRFRYFKSNQQPIALYREGVLEPELKAVELTTAPTKDDYYAGESFNPAGMVITAKYTHGGEDKVLEEGEYTLSKTVLELGDEFVTVSYTEDGITKTVDVPVTVTKAPVPVTGISLDKTEVSMKVNEEDITLAATVAPEDADDPTVVWSVSKEGVVTVNNGVVHAVAAGEVTVTATAGDFHADCVVTVAPADKMLSGIEVTTPPNKTSYVVGEIFDPTGMVVTASYSSGHDSEEVTGYTYSTAVLEETDTTVEIDYNGQKAYVTISVSPAPVLDSISVANAEGKTNTYSVGAVISKDDLVVTAHYTQGKQDAVVTDYTISKTTALAVTDTSVTISYTEGGIEKTATYSFTVTKPTEPQIDVSNVDLYSIDAASLGLDSYADGTNTDLAWTMLCKGNSDTLQGNSSKSSELHNKIAFSKNITYIKFNVGYAAGAAATGSVRFGSSVTPTGNDTSYGANTDLSLVTVGSFNVSAPAGCNYFSVVWTKGASYFSSIEVHFNEMGSEEQVAVQSVSLNKTSTSINVGSNETLVATVAPSNANDKSVTWSSSNSSIATVDSTGKVTGIAQGTATITVTTTDGEKTASCSVTVVPAGSTTSSPIDLGGSATVVFNGTSYSNSIKTGSSKVAGSTTISVPSGAKKLTFYAAGWNKESVTISVSGGGISKSLSLTSDEGVSGNGPTYTLGSTDDASFKFEIDVSSLSGATTLTISATSGKRFVLWNASYIK